MGHGTGMQVSANSGKSVNDFFMKNECGLLLEHLMQRAEFEKFLEDELHLVKPNAGNAAALKAQQKQLVKDLGLKERLILKKRFMFREQLKRDSNGTKSADSTIIANSESANVLEYNAYENEQTLIKYYDQKLHEQRMFAAKMSSLGTILMHNFYVFVGLYSTAEASTIAITAAYAVNNSKNIADVVLTAGALVFFVSVTTVLWFLWNLADTLGVYINAWKEYKNGNMKIAMINLCSATQLLIGTLVTAIVLYGGTVAGLGLGLAPVTFAICMFCAAWVAAVKIRELEELGEQLIAFDPQTTLENLSNGAVAERAHEMVKQLLINYGVANEDVSELDQALMHLTVEQVSQIRLAALDYQKTSRWVWLSCGGAMSVVATLLIGTVGAAVLAFPPLAIAIVAVFAAMFVFGSLSARVHLQLQDGLTKHKIMMIVHGTNPVSDNAAPKEALSVNALSANGKACAYALLTPAAADAVPISNTQSAWNRFKLFVGLPDGYAEEQIHQSKLLTAKT